MGASHRQGGRATTESTTTESTRRAESARARASKETRPGRRRETEIIENRRDVETYSDSPDRRDATGDATDDALDGRDGGL